METDYGWSFALSVWFRGAVALVATIWAAERVVEHATNFGRWCWFF